MNGKDVSEYNRHSGVQVHFNKTVDTLETLAVFKLLRAAHCIELCLRRLHSIELLTNKVQSTMSGKVGGKT